MKKFCVTMLLVSLILLSACSAVPGLIPPLVGKGVEAALDRPDVVSQTDSTPDQRRVTVTGSAQVMVIPDEVLLTLGVETSDKKLPVARQANDEIVQRVLSIAEEMQIDSKYVQSDYISIEPRYQDSYTQKSFIGFFVRKNIVITLKDLTKFEELYARLLEAGVNYIRGVEFRTTELRKYRDQARALAIKAAQEKAVALAGELDQTVGQPVTIQENSDYWWSGYSSWWGSAGTGMYQNVVQNSGQAPADIESTLAPGQIGVTANVTVEFVLK